MREVPSLLTDLASGRVPVAAANEQVDLAAARDHRMTGLLWTWAATALPPGSDRSWLAVNDLHVQGHHAHVWKVLEESVRRLRATGIDVATVKGVTAEARWYHRRGERPCSDLDLLLAPVDLRRSADAVGVLQPEHPLRPHLDELVASGRLQAITLQVDGLEVDLHFDLFKLGFPTRQATEIWCRTSEFALPGGGSVRVLDPTTALVHLLVHLNKDRFQRLLGYADIARILETGDVDWADFRRLTQGEGFEVTVGCSLDAVLAELGLPWPVELQRPVGGRAVLWRILWRRSIRLRGAEGRLRFRRRQTWIALLSAGRAREAAAWWLREMWPPRVTVDHHYADLRGPYLWKLIRGRLRAGLDQQRALSEVRHARRSEPMPDVVAVAENERAVKSP